MSSGYSKSLKYLYGLQWHGIKLGLENVRRLSEALGHPHERFRAIHIAGTNGKGSTAAMAGAVFREAGFSTGVYTSPHLVDFTERIRVNGDPISGAGVADLTDRIRRAADGIPLTFFEFTTAMAFLFFAESKVEIGIFETGMGGRFDATNILTPAVSVITNVELDHVKFLGETVSEIAFEKAGIIKKNVPVVTAAERPDALEVIGKTAREQGAPVYRLGRDFKLSPARGGRFRYEGMGRSIEDLRVALPGKHQVKNAACALAAVELAGTLPEEGKGVTDEAVRKGLAGVRWPGRLERFFPKTGGPEVILDGAHNPAAASALRDYLAAELAEGGPRLVLVVGILNDKDAAGILEPLVPLVREAIATQPGYDRALPAERLKNLLAAHKLPVTVRDTIPAALQAAGEAARSGERILVTGSLFTVGEARSFLLGLPEPSALKG